MPCGHKSLVKSAKLFSSAESASYAPDLTLEPVHGTLDLEFDIPSSAIKGLVTWTFRNRGPAIDSPKITLNAVGFVELDANIDYIYDGKELSAFWKCKVQTGDLLTITITYKVINPIGGLYFNVPSESYPQKTLHAITDNESERARYWLPCIDFPAARTMLDFIIRYDNRYSCFTNGVLTRTEKNSPRDGLDTSYFKHEFLTPSYLICVAVGDFITVDDGVVGTIPIKYIAPRGIDPKDLKQSFAETPKMIKWIQEKLDFPFPWKKYDQIVSIHIMGNRIGSKVSGAMENISLVSWGDMYVMDDVLHSERGWAVECTNIHEMAHTYFGDLIVMRHFDHVWLKESWATYFEALWLEYSWTQDDFFFEMYQNQESYVSETNIYARNIVTKHFEYSWAMFDAHTYPGGAWRIHMLRKLLGDSAFWNGVQDYVKKFVNKTVETSDFRKCLEESSGLNLTKFFDQWFYSCGFPKIEGKFSVQIDKKLANISLEQVQKEPFYRFFDMTLEIELIDSEGIIYQKNLEFQDGKAFATFSLGEAKIKIIRIDPEKKVLFTLDMNPGEEILESCALEASDIFTRIWAYKELINIGTYSSFNRIQTIIHSEPFYGVRIYVAKALSKSLYSEAYKILGQMLKKEKDPKAMYRIASECKIQDSEIRECILEFLKPDNLPYQAKAAGLEALGYQRCAEDVDFLLKISKNPGSDQHGIVCSGAIRGLGASRCEKAYDFLLSSLDTPSSFHERVRASIIPSLASVARWMPPSLRSIEIVTEKFLSILPRDENQRVRFNIVKGLVTLEARSTIPTLNAAGCLFDSRHLYSVKEEIQKLRESGGLSVSELLTSLEKLESRLSIVEAKNRELANRL